MRIASIVKTNWILTIGLAVVAAVAAFFHAGAPTASADTTFTVNSTADELDANPGDGRCRTAARTCTLRAAVQEANALSGPDIITLPAGTYGLTRVGWSEDAGLTGDLDIRDSLTINGAGSGTTTIESRDGTTAFGHDRIIDVRREALYVRITGVTVRNGLVLGDGGGIRNDGAHLIIERSLIADNDAGHVARGGGIFSTGWLELREVEVRANGAFYGGGILTGGRATLNSVIVASNHTHGVGTPTDIPDEGKGAGIANYGALDITGGEIRYNNGVYGGGIANLGSSLFVSGVRLRGNTAHDGGAIWNAQGTATVTNSTLFENRASRSGGAIYNSAAMSGYGFDYRAGTLILTKSTLNGNRAEHDRPSQKGYGGALSIGGSTSLITNSTISGNTATGFGGGIWTIGTVSIESSTIFGNSATLAGGGVAGSGQMRVLNTIIAGSTGGDCARNISTRGYNLDSDRTCGFVLTGDISGRDPKLAGLARSRGTAETHAPVAGSPAIDAGFANCTGIDQRDVTRPIDGNGDGRAVCDIGAHEAEPRLTIHLPPGTIPLPTPFPRP